ncbi:hypothetical protein AXF42_Ash006302 [Apostasia shenzhenica]|uniref:Uncharacterized protein n=1 Tax=Apostasia shenzhenica TaxID=1088818 RepID=A0A2I0AYQ9_9ASPA|nr:hypothetical protein AXF42_Ash006302 [Apostasia shenzhenica]
MQRVGYSQVASVPKKGKKKQPKPEIDRLKQAEKKKRRLEKALANSAAIRSELEKKKLKKIEEQQRLDEEGAAIAESVALHVLVEEDSDDPFRHFVLKNSYRSDPWVLVREDKFADNAVEASSAWYSGRCGMGHSFPFGVHFGDFYEAYDEEMIQEADISAGILAAKAVSSLQIVEDSHQKSHLPGNELGFFPLFSEGH